MSSLRGRNFARVRRALLAHRHFVDALSRRALGSDHHAIPNLRCGGWSGCSTTSLQEERRRATAREEDD